MDKTVSIASAAFADWRNTSPTQRAQIMFAFRSLLDGAKNELADIIAGVHGKTKQDAMSCSTTKR